jgi:hypothetical protein
LGKIEGGTEMEAEELTLEEEENLIEGEQDEDY